jgi:hydrogenase/urease accessory protein HupE
MSRTTRGFLVGLATLAQLGVAAIAVAHPGHGHGENPWGVLHYLTEPEHVSVQAFLLLATALGATWIGSLPLRRWIRRRVDTPKRDR